MKNGNNRCRGDRRRGVSKKEKDGGMQDIEANAPQMAFKVKKRELRRRLEGGRHLLHRRGGRGLVAGRLGGAGIAAGAGGH